MEQRELMAEVRKGRQGEVWSSVEGESENERARDWWKSELSAGGAVASGAGGVEERV